jgi:hypothetical protein
MRHVKTRFLIGKFAMYTMPRSFPLSKKWLAPVSVFVLLLLVFLAGVDAGAQKKKRPATGPKPQQQSAGTNSNTQTAQAKPQKKNITPLKSGETSEGSRITITSDAPLNDYSAYRSGDRYYVVIPEANAPRAAGGMRGRGFEDVQVQKRGNDAILSFKLQPGTNARVSQRFNRLDVELTAPGGKTAAVPTATPKTATLPTATPTPQTSARPTPQTTTIGQNPPVNGNTGQTANPQINSGATNPILTPPVAGGNPPVVYAPTPDASASPGVSPASSPVTAPPSEQIAQAQPPTTSQPATTTSTSATSGTSFGTMLRQNWLVILIAALVLLSLVMIVAARSRAQRDTSAAAAAAPARSLSRKERRAAKQASAELAEADKATPVADVLYKSSTLKAKPLTTDVPVVVASGGTEAVEAEAKAAPVLEEEETKEIEVAQPVDVERVGNEIKNVLAGESYDQAVIGATDTGTRQLIATELLSALAARNVERRARARAAFVKHDYLDEATRKLRTADAPAERAAAARSLGYVQDKSTTPHLVAALDDKEPEVRRAAVESLAELHDPSAIQPLKDLLKRERDRKVSRSLIKRAIEASAAVEEETTTVTPAVAPETETVTLETEAPALEAEQAPVELADVSSTEVAPGLVAVGALPLVTEEVDTQAEEAAQREAEEARQRAEEEERLRVEAEAQRQAEEEASLAAEAKAADERRQAEEAARLQAEEEERVRAAEEERLRIEAEARQRAEEEAARVLAEEEARQRIAEEARLQAEAEAQRQAAEDARLKAATEARLKAEEETRLAAEAEAQRKATEEAARLHAEAAARLKAEAEARQRAEEETARRLAEEEAARRAQEERLRLAEEARQRAEAEAAAELRAQGEAARVRAEEEARQREEEEALRLAEVEAQRKAAEESRLAVEAEAQRKAEEESARRLAAEEAAAMLSAEAISPVEHEAAAETLTAEQSTLVQPVEPFIEHHDALASGWVDIDVSAAQHVRHQDPVSVSPMEETATQETLTFEPALESIEAGVQESKEIEPAGFSIIAEPAAKPVSKEIDYAVTERGIAEFDEYSSVPGVILKRLSSEEPTERATAVADLARVGGDDSFREISAAFDDPAVEVRNAAARSLFNLNADRAATFTRALRESPPERRRKIGAALASSGLASEAIGQLMGESREKTYDAFSLLFLMSKAGEVQPLMRAIEEHPNNEVRLAVVKLLALSGQQEILPAFRRLAVRGSLPTEVRSAVMEAIYQISSQSPTAA